MEKRPPTVTRLAAALAVLIVSTPFALAQDPNAPPAEEPPTGQLKLLGEHVTELLVAGQGTDFERTFSQDELTAPISLRPGTYYIGVTLQGGYKCTSRDNKIEIEADETTDLKNGAPPHAKCPCQAPRQTAYAGL